MAWWSPVSEYCKFRTRIWKRLIEWGYKTREIGAWFDCSHASVSHSCRGYAREQEKLRRETRARIWSRLVSAPISMTLGEVGKIWGVSKVCVCNHVSAIRYYSPRGL